MESDHPSLRRLLIGSVVVVLVFILPDFIAGEVEVGEVMTGLLGLFFATWLFGAAFAGLKWALSKAMKREASFRKDWFYSTETMLAFVVAGSIFVYFFGPS